MKLTALIEKSKDGWYVGQIQEFPAAISQGKTILREELRVAWNSSNTFNRIIALCCGKEAAIQYT